MKAATFTKEMKKTHTILLPQMLEYHSPFLKAAFENSGYKFAVMKSSGRLKGRSLKYISNDYCYPAVLIVGQILEVLEEGLYEVDKVAFMEPQAGGACRAGNYYNTIIKTLQKSGFSYVPVISLNFKGKEKQEGFQVTPKLLFDAIEAVCYGDLMMSLYQQIKPIEKVKGETDWVYQVVQDELIRSMKKGRSSKKRRRENYKYIVEYFKGISTRSETKKKVGVTGEIYIKFSSLGNHNLEKQLEENGCQCVMGGFINYALYIVDSEKKNYQTNTSHPLRGVLGVFDSVVRLLENIQRELYDVVKKESDFYMDTSFSTLKKKAESIIGYGCITGDGWLIAAEVVELIEKGCKNVLIVHPFGCLVSHICERGILKRLHELYPGINIQTIEYDYDSSDTLRESRIMLGIGEV